MSLIIFSCLLIHVLLIVNLVFGISLLASAILTIPGVFLGSFLKDLLSLSVEMWYKNRAIL